MNVGPRITVVTIGYNVREELRRTIESVNAQTYAAIEHIIIDGGSRDGSIELIQHLARRAARWVSEADRGIADAFNKGTRLATGDFLCYLNAGDEFVDRTVVERVVAHLEPAGAEPVVYHGDFVASLAGVERWHATSARPQDFAWENPLNHQSTFIPRSLALELPYDVRLTLGMDYDFWLRALARARFRKLPVTVARFDLGGRSNSREWAVHGAVMRRVLWHVNRGTRFSARDLVLLSMRSLQRALKLSVGRLLGRRVTLAVRAARTRWRGPTRPAPGALSEAHSS